MDEENTFHNTWVGTIPPMDLKRLRIQAGYSQSEFATKFGLAGRTEVSHIESGRRTITLGIITRYAEALGVEVVISFAKLFPAQTKQTKEDTNNG